MCSHVISFYYSPLPTNFDPTRFSHFFRKKNAFTSRGFSASTNTGLLPPLHPLQSESHHLESNLSGVHQHRTYRCAEMVWDVCGQSLPYPLWSATEASPASVAWRGVIHYRLVTLLTLIAVTVRTPAPKKPLNTTRASDCSLTDWQQESDPTDEPYGWRGFPVGELLGSRC